MVDSARRGRGERDDPPPRRGREEEPRRGREASRSEPAPRERGGRDREEPRGRGERSSGAASTYRYQPRDKSVAEKRANMGASEFDRMFKDGVKVWTPAKGDNNIRIMPPTWPGADNFGYDVFVHYSVGPDRASYLDLTKMLDQPDPIAEEHEEMRRAGADKEELRELESKRRVVVYLIDRDNEGEGPQIWAMPWTIDKDINQIAQDKQTGELLNIDDPDEGYDISFRKDGEKMMTKYSGVSIARRPSRLGKMAWLDHAVENPIPSLLKYYTYEEIAKAFTVGGAHRERDTDDRDRDDRDDRDPPRRGREDREEPASRGRDRDDENTRDRDRAADRGRSRDDDDAAPADESRRGDRGGRGGRGGAAAEPEPPTLTWESVHDMTTDELDALCAEDDRLADINPDEAASDDELMGWICEDLGLKKAESRRRERAPAPAADTDDKLTRMRESRRR